MVLLCNGDSWTQGDHPSQQYNWEATKSLDWYDIIPQFGNPTTGNVSKNWPSVPAEQRVTDYKFYDSDVWPKVLGRELKLPTYNSGRLGCSNQIIVRSTLYSIKYLQDKGYKDIFVVIGWTTMYRQDIFEKRDGKYEIAQRRPNPDFKELDKYGSEIDFRYNTLFSESIIALQSFLTLNKIPFLFFNAFDVLDKGTNPLLHSYIDKNNWVNKTYEVPHFKSYISEKYNTDWSHNNSTNKYFVGSHPTDFSHIQWGKYLAKYIKEKFAF